MMTSPSDAKDITLRDYFAAKAMQGLVSLDPSALIAMKKEEEKIGEFVVRTAYHIANLMMKERQNDNSKTPWPSTEDSND